VIVLLPTVWAIGLSQRVDQLQGLTSGKPGPVDVDPMGQGAAGWL
jgi:hypothetical protein